MMTRYSMVRSVLSAVTHLGIVGPVARRLLGVTQQNGLELRALVGVILSLAGAAVSVWMLAVGNFVDAALTLFMSLFCYGVAKFMWLYWEAGWSESEDDDDGPAPDPDPRGGLVLRRIQREHFDMALLASQLDQRARREDVGSRQTGGTDRPGQP